MISTNWKNYTKSILKANLAQMLGDRDIEESPQNINNKIAIGTFGAIFMMQVLDTIECNNLHISGRLN